MCPMDKKLVSDKRSYILTERNKPLGVLKYPKWYSLNALIELKRDKIELKQKGFWGTKYVIRQNGFNIGLISTDWKGHISLEIPDNHKRLRKLKLKSSGVFKIKYHLLDEKKNTLLTLKPISSWSKLRSDFEIEDVNDITALNGITLCLYTCFCVRLFQQHVGASAAGATG